MSVDEEILRYIYLQISNNCGVEMKETCVIRLAKSGSTNL